MYVFREDDSGFMPPTEFLFLYTLTQFSAWSVKKELVVKINFPIDWYQ